MKKIIMASITAVVVIAVLAGTLIPILDDATATQGTFTNKGYMRMSAVSATDADTTTITWDADDPSKFTVNDVVVTPTLQSGNYTYSAIFGDDWLVRAQVTSGAISLLQFYGSSNTTVDADATITLSAGTMTLVCGDTTKTETYTTAYVPDADGDFIMKYADTDAYLVGEESLIVGFGLTRTSEPSLVGAPGYGIKVEGTINDGVTVTQWRGTENIVFSDITINAVENNDYVDLYSFSSVTFIGTVTATVDGTETTGENEITYSYVLVPYQVTAEKSVHFTDGENAILSAIPAMIIIALLLGVVALVLRSRMD